MTMSEQWPSQDGIDRSGSIAIIARLHLDPREMTTPLDTQDRWDLVAEVRPQLEQAVNATLAQLRDLQHEPIEVERYQVGPAVEGVDYWIATIWDSRNQIPSLLIGMAVESLVRSVAAQLRKWATGLRRPGIGVTLVFPPEVLALLCEGHITRIYGPFSQVKSVWRPITTEFYGGYQSPSHPTDMMNYQIEVQSDSVNYRFEIDGTASISKLRRLDANGIIDLPVPDLLFPANETPSEQQLPIH